MQNLPAHATKHVTELDYLLPDRATRVTVYQDNQTSNSTGRTVWLGAQVLSVYLHDLLSSKSLTAQQQRRRAIDLGSGTGLVALSLASIGYDALATDVEMIVDGVLKRNVEANAARLSGRIRAEALDWFTFDRATWPATTLANGDSVDLLTTADTVYDSSLSAPLLRTLHGLSLIYAKPSPPPVYLALEARDPALIAAFFVLAASEPFGFKCSRVDPGRIRKIVEAKDGTLGWRDESDWEGVEVWKMVLSKREVARAKAERKAAAG